MFELLFASLKFNFWTSSSYSYKFNEIRNFRPNIFQKSFLSFVDIYIAGILYLIKLSKVFDRSNKNWKSLLQTQKWLNIQTTPSLKQFQRWLSIEMRQITPQTAGYRWSWFMAIP